MAPSRPRDREADADEYGISVTFRVPGEMLVRFDAMVRELDLDRTKILRRLMREEVERYESTKTKKRR